LVSGGGLDAADILRIVTQLGNSTAFADDAISQIQANRMYEIYKLTTPEPVDKPIDFNRTKTLMPTPSLTMRPSHKQSNQTKTLVPTPSLSLKPIDFNQTRTFMPTPSLTKPIDFNQTKTLVPTPGLTMKLYDKRFNETKTLVPTPSEFNQTQ